MNDNKVIEIQNLLHKIEDRNILNINELIITGGLIHAITGPNGAGKTTLLSIINMLIKPTSGEIIYFDCNYNHNYLKIRREMTLVMQKPLLFNSTVYENMAYGLRIRGIDSYTTRERVMKYLDMLDLKGYENRRTKGLSGGELQRVAIARAIALETKILLLDEFTNNIDEKYCEIVENIIRKINEEIKNTIVMVTHQFDQAHRIADRIFHLKDGTIIQTISLKEKNNDFTQTIS